ncbi:MAG: hypothetical protein HY908_03790, partial [Myxococcales bacterium]|nr:hypothetical protein [Myxococcales bacterium]
LLDATQRAALADALEQKGGMPSEGGEPGHRRGAPRGAEGGHRGPRPPAER